MCIRDRDLKSSNPDGREFPDFDDNLRQAFQRETELLFESILHEDRSVLDLLDADYKMCIRDRVFAELLSAGKEQRREF